MENWATLAGIANDREITRVGDPQFWYTCQQSILLALKEEGVLSETQYRRGEAILKARFPVEKGGEA